MVNYPIDFLLGKIKNKKQFAKTIAINARKCNRTCGYCAMKNTNWLQVPFDVFEIEAAFDEAFEKNENPHLLFVGGEPFYDSEAVEIFIHLCNKYKDKLSLVDILSNMDNWDAYKDRILNLPNKNISITSTSRTQTFYESTDKVDIFNKIFLDELMSDFNYPVGPSYKYLFNLKIPTYWNDIGDEYVRDLDMIKISEKIDWFYKNGSVVKVDSLITFGAKKKLVEGFFEETGVYKTMVNFPSGWKNEIEVKEKICVECKEDCLLAIPGNKCKILPGECSSCEYLPICAPLNESKLGFNKHRFPSCENLKKVINLAEKYRKLQSNDPIKTSKWNY